MKFGVKLPRMNKVVFSIIFLNIYKGETKWDLK